MVPFMAMLTEADMENLAAYYASLQWRRPPARLSIRLAAYLSHDASLGRPYRRQ